MHLFDLGERVETGWPVSVDIKRKRLFLNLGRSREDPDVPACLRFGPSLTDVFFKRGVPSHEMSFEDLHIMRAGLTRHADDTCLRVQPRPDGRALIRAGIAPGVDGKIWYVFGEGVEVIAEGVLGFEEIQFPMYVLLMNTGAQFEVHRTGELEGLPDLMIVHWDGSQLHLNV